MRLAPLTLAALLTLSLCAAAAQAAPTPTPAPAPDPKADAAAEAEAGDRAFAIHDNAAALAHYEEAYRLYPSPNLQFNRGLALVELHRNAEAVTAFEAFLDGAKTAPAKARDYASDEIRKLEPKVARLRIIAQSPSKQPIPGAKVILNGRVVGTLPAERGFALEPGDCQVEVTADGYQPYRIDTMRVAAGAPAKLVAVMAPLDLSVKRDPGHRGASERESPSVLRSWWLWGAIGTIAIAATVATILVLRGDGGPDSDLGTVEPRF